MLRGELSNQPAAICAIDYRIILDTKKPLEWFAKKVDTALFSKSFESAIKRFLPWKKHAKLWLERNWERRLVVFSVGVPMLERAIEMVVGDYIVECYHFRDKYEFRAWIYITKQLYKVYTNDPELLGLDEIIQQHKNWLERA